MAWPVNESDDASTTERAVEDSPPKITEAGSTWRSARRLLTYGMHVDSAGLCIAIGTAFAASIAEGTGILLLLPLLQIAGMNMGSASTAGRLGAFVQMLLQRGGVPHSLWLPVALGFFLLVAGLRSVLRRTQSMMTYATTMKVELALSQSVYESVIRAQWGYLVRQRSGRMTHLLTAELHRVGEAMSHTLSMINLGCLTLLYLVIAFKLSAQMTLLVLAIGGVLIVLQRRSLDRVRSSAGDLHESIAEVYAATEEHLLNMKSVKTYNAEARDVQLFAALCNDVARHGVTSAKHHAASAFRFEMGSLLALGGVIFLALSVLHVQAAAMLLLLAVFTRLMPQLASMQNEMHQLASTLPAFDHVLAIESECLHHAEAPAPDHSIEQRPLGLRSELRLEDVWFTYRAEDRVSDTGSEFVLRGIDLEIRAGMLTALVGPSGAGKSTIADLANGLLQPTSGRLILDGNEIGPGEMRRWRSQVGYVGQDTVLFHQSVRENLLWAKPDANPEEMREALLLASAEFVYELPGGLDSVVGDRGILLSSGQRQRISIARALLRRPALLILDEATNALDVENESRVLGALLEAIRASKQSDSATLTVLMIAHRASAICRADRVVELDGGRIERTETPAQLGFEPQ
jgi:ABC-type multidrug transport system fused ATPase/permease subunit